MSQCKYDHCHEDMWDGCSEGFCLYHSPNNGRDDATARKVWEKARAIVNSQANLEYMFSGWHFPKDPGRQWFHICIFKHPVHFDNAVFEDHIEFKFARFESHAGFENVVFKGPAIFEMATFRRSAIFWGTVFCDQAGFTYSTFHDITGFDDTEFRDDALFNSSTFRSTVTFGGTTFFARRADFSGVGVRDGNSFSVSPPTRERSRGELRAFRLTEEGEGLYRLAKESARRQGDYLMAGEYYYAEQCAIEYANRKKCRCKIWHFLAEWLFARNIFGYGEKPHRALIVALVVIILCAGLHFSFAGIAPTGLAPAEVANYQPSVGESLYFSVVSFTTLGYGDLVPKPGFRWLASTEAALGAVLMAVFIVCLTRKYMR